MKPFCLLPIRARCLSPTLVLRLAFKPLTVLALAASGLMAHAATIEVSADTSLQAAIDAAQAGDILMLAPGTYQGNIIVNKPLTLQGPSNRQAVLLGEREGRTVWVQAEDVQIRQITVRNSGLSLPDMDAGIFLDKPAHNALIENNDILDNLVGVYVWGPHNALVQNNTIVGNKELRLNERGNGVTLWNSPALAFCITIFPGVATAFFPIPAATTFSAITALPSCAMRCTTCTPITARSAAMFP